MIPINILIVLLVQYIYIDTNKAYVY